MGLLAGIQAMQSTTGWYPVEDDEATKHKVCWPGLYVVVAVLSSYACAELLRLLNQGV